MTHRAAAAALVALALGLTGLPATSATAAAGTVTIASPSAGAASGLSGTPLAIEASSSSDASSVTLAMSGCTITPAKFTAVTAGTPLSASANCPAGATSKLLTVKATYPDGTIATSTRTVTFDTATSTSVELDIDRNLAPMCTGKASYSAQATTSGGQPVMGLPVTATLGSATVTARTDAAGRARLLLPLTAGTLSAATSATGPYTASPNATLAAVPDTCSVRVTIDEASGPSVTYLEAASAHGHVYLERDSDLARVPLSGQTVTVKLGSKTLGTPKTNTLGEWAVTAPAASQGQWTASATTRIAGISTPTDTAIGDEVTITPYNATMALSDPALPRTGYHVAGGRAKSTLTLTARHPATNETSGIVAKGVPLRAVYQLAGETGGMVLSTKAKTGSTGTASIQGTIGGNGVIRVSADPTSVAVQATPATVAVSAQARVKLHMNARSAPVGDRINVTVTAYPQNTGTATIEYRAGLTDPWQTLTTVPLGEDTPIDLPDTAGKYTLRAVVAASSQAESGTSKTSRITVTETPENVVVSNLACTSVNSEQPTCSWDTPVVNPGQTVTGYLVKAGSATIATISDPNTTTVTLPSTISVPGKSAPVTVVRPGTATRVSVTPTLSTGTAAAARAVTTRLDAPASGTVTTSGNETLLTWTSVRGADEGYLVSIDGGTPRVAMTTGYLLVGLSPTSHTFTVTARNSLGDTSAPLTLDMTGSAELPSAPPAVSATGGNTLLEVSWAAPDDGGSPITDYVVEYAPVGSGTWTVASDGVSDSTSTTITGLVNGQSYDVRVAATNLVGTGAYSDTTTATPMTVPGSVNDLSGTSGPSTVTLTWTPPSSDGGSPIQSYRVYRYDTTEATWTLISEPTGLSYVDTSAPIGETSQYRVSAVNAAGQSAYANTSAAAYAPLVLSYASSQFVREQNGQQLAPAVTGGTGTLSYSLSGTLPTGVTFNSSTGVFTGPNLNSTVAGSLDTAFAANVGGAANNTVYDIVQTSDGGWLVVGAFTTWNGAAAGRAVKLNSDGTPDTAFNTNLGTGSTGTIYDAHVQADGKILLAGPASWNGTTLKYILRLNTDGTLDSGFHSNMGTGAVGLIQNVIEQPDGKVLLRGNFATFNGANAGGLARVNADGTLDTAFAANMPTTTSGTFAMALMPNGKIVLGGLMTTWKGLSCKYVLRLNSDGTRDTSFDTNIGTAASATVWSLAAQPDGKLLVGGQFLTWNGTTVNGIVRLNSDGTRDTVFTSNTGTGTGGSSKVARFALDSGGRILVGGAFTTWNGQTRRYLVRLNSTGTVDTTWAPTDAGNGIEALAIGSGDKAMAGGTFSSWSGQSASRFAALNDYGPAATPGFPSEVTITVDDSGTGQSTSTTITLDVA